MKDSSVPTLPDRLRRQDCALVLIDMQQCFADLIHEMPAVAANCSRLVRFCQRLDIPVVVTEHYPRGLGVTMEELSGLFDPFAPLEKITFSCVLDEGFNDAMDKLGRKQIILCGIETHVCVYQTALDFLHRGRQVAVATDAVSSCSAQNRRLGLDRMRDIGVQVMGAQMIMFEILKVAKTDDFKKVADLLKD